MNAVLHRHITTNNTSGKLTYEKIDLSANAVSLAVTGDIVSVMAGDDWVAAARLGEKDYITLEPEAAAAQ
jgi:hypothetical protein